LDRTNKRLFIVAGSSPERFLVSVFLASEKFNSDLELDAGMHKTNAHPKPMGMGIGTQCRALLCCEKGNLKSQGINPSIPNHHSPQNWPQITVSRKDYLGLDL
jgi:hypothetical protein